MPQLHINKKGGETEAINYFRFSPLRATTGLQRLALPERWRPLLYFLLTLIWEMDAISQTRFIVLLAFIILTTIGFIFNFPLWFITDVNNVEVVDKGVFKIKWGKAEPVDPHRPPDG